jgi:hypothetical protein
MPESLLKILKLFVVVGALVIVGGTATLVWLLVKRGADMAVPSVTTAAHLPATIELPPGGEISQLAVASSQLVLLGRAPGEGQFVLVVDLATGARRQLLRLAPAPP